MIPLKNSKYSKCRIPKSARYSLFCFVHVGTSFSKIEFGFISSIDSFNFKKSRVLPLISKAPLVASKSGFAP
ncbi:hypothetical protein XELAEV_18029568mg [Xenopus laevis]|uniref:Uncharacterized protein n=1 Tax=Xenopus laevis TaxID=8355 RepID=A0A974CTR7_XENLA|nr:hypothetical protein XELAEV_18029568mg [Xenopus laevis]